MKAVGGRKTRVAVLTIVVVAVIVWSAARGAPKVLPGAALGWAPLFYVERAGALLGAFGVIVVIGWRALQGRFPIKFANIEYADELKASAETVDSHEQRLKLLEDYLDLAGPSGDVE
jgi:hypothetical protein